MLGLMGSVETIANRPVALVTPPGHSYQKSRSDSPTRPFGILQSSQCKPEGPSRWINGVRGREPIGCFGPEISFACSIVQKGPRPFAKPIREVVEPMRCPHITTPRRR